MSGRQRKKPADKERMTVYLPLTLAGKLRVVAARLRRSVSGIVEDAIRKWLSRNGEDD